jgi:TetR/AcrR family transcriptional regulator, mexJK operon transcriptional repressor
MRNGLESNSLPAVQARPSPDDHVASGWQRKHRAIAGAASVLFARDGYERTSVDAIAAEAGVSKRTVYSHYVDKENLFLLVLRETYDVMRDRVGSIVDRTLRDVDDIEKSLTECVLETVRAITRAPERSTLVRLIMSEAPHFPDVLALWRNGGIVPLLAEALTPLAASGRLAADDPAQAAEHLYALTFGQVNIKSMLGTIELSDAVADRIVTSGVRVFMRAYAPGPA